jgi:tetratricopeptide (TPR) repeat protein
MLARLLDRALEALERRLGETHPDLAEDLFNLGLLLFAGERYERARYVLIRALTIQTKHLGFDHPDVKETLDVLAALNGEEAEAIAQLSAHAPKGVIEEEACPAGLD